MKFILSQISKLFFPSACLHCHTAVASGEPLCAACYQLIEPIYPNTFCRACLKESRTPLCSHCRKETIYIDKYAALMYEGPTKSLLHQFKFHHRRYLAELFGAWLVIAWESFNLPIPDIITAPPSSWVKSFWRPYNPAELIAIALAKHLKKPYQTLLKNSPTRKFKNYHNRGTSVKT
jgi:Predicted amidophosphoribosyltransferases